MFFELFYIQMELLHFVHCIFHFIFMSVNYILYTVNQERAGLDLCMFAGAGVCVKLFTSESVACFFTVCCSRLISTLQYSQPVC